MNCYEPNNELQSAFDNLFGSCLCSRNESCSWCEPSAFKRRNKLQEFIIKQAIKENYQLYVKGFPVWREHYPLDYGYWKETGGV